MVDLVAKNQSLEIEVTVLRQKLVETTAATGDVLELLSSSKAITADDCEITVAGSDEKEELTDDEDGRLPAVDATDETVGMDEEVAECCAIAETLMDDTSEGTMEDLEEDQLGLMTCSMSSTTSGFDDNSCASSVWHRFLFISVG